MNYLRLELLAEVGRLQKSLGVVGDVTYTCETAGYFNLYQVLSIHSLLQSTYGLTYL